MSGLQIRNIQKSFGSQTALSSIDLEIRKGEFFSLLGPSGCGKSTLLRILAGLEPATSGEILWEGQPIQNLPARERPFNMVFQKYALFPHLSVFENVAFGLKLQKLGKAEIESRVREALDLVNLKGFERRLPETLSGGQSQRVALARALVNRPQIVLLDEPLTALDQKLREHMQTELRLLQRRLDLTFIFVTHDQEEAMLLSDRIAVMNGGRVEQVSEPRFLYERPGSLFSARFIGRRNELDVDAIESRDGWVDLALGVSRLKGRSACERLNEQGRGGAHVFVPPERVRVLTGSRGVTPGLNHLEGAVVQILFRGASSEMTVDLGESRYLRVLSDLDSVQNLSVGERVGLEFPPEETHVFLAVPQ